jgi:hypothetical protein
LRNNQLGNYLIKSKKQIFLNNICLTSILQKAWPTKAKGEENDSRQDLSVQRVKRGLFEIHS